MIVPEGMDSKDVAWLRSFTPESGGSRLPDEAIVEGVIAVVPYIDGEGESKWMLWWRCDLPASQMVGLLEMAQLKLLHDFGVFDDPGEDEGEAGL